jgi:hypothetical protein
MRFNYIACSGLPKKSTIWLSNYFVTFSKLRQSIFYLFEREREREREKVHINEILIK